MTVDYGRKEFTTSSTVHALPYKDSISNVRAKQMQKKNLVEDRLTSSNRLNNLYLYLGKRTLTSLIFTNKLDGYFHLLLPSITNPQRPGM